MPPPDCQNARQQPELPTGEGFTHLRENVIALDPRSDESEIGILGCMMLGPSAAIPGALNAGVIAGMFHDLQRRELFKTLVAMHADGRGIDLLTVHEKLKAARWYEAAGGSAFLSDILGAVPSAANLSYYIDPLRKAHGRRSVLDLARRLGEMARNPSIDPDSLFADSEAILQSIRDSCGCSDLPPICEATAFLADSQSKPQEIVSGLLHQGSKLVLGGGSKSFKTWTLLDLACSVATGSSYLDFETSRGRVLYINFEIQSAFFRERLEAVLDAKGVGLQAPQFEVWNLRGYAADFSTLVPKILNRAQQRGYSLIVLDPIYKLYGERTDENSAGDVARLLRAIESLAVRTGAAVAFGAHFSKGNQSTKESIDRISGSGVFARDPDSLLVFTRHEEKDAFTVEPTLRNFKPVEPFCVRWRFPLMRREADLDPARLKRAGGRTPNHVAKDLLDALPHGGLSTTEWMQEAAESGIKERTFYRLKTELLKANRVVKSQVSGKWQPLLIRTD